MVGWDSCLLCDSGVLGRNVRILGCRELAAPCKREECVEGQLAHVSGEDGGMATSYEWGI